MKSNEFAGGACQFHGCGRRLGASNSTGFCQAHVLVAGPPCAICGGTTSVSNRSGMCARCTWEGK